MTISTAGPSDTAAIAGLLAEMGRFYRAPQTEPLEERERQIRDALFGDPPAAHALLARDGDRLAGMAAYSFLWPAAGLTRSLYLKELYVAEGYRRRGTGTLLMRAVCEMAGKHRCSRIEWTTDRGNTRAQEFYRRLGFPFQPAKIFYRIEDTGGGFLIAT